MPKNSKAKERYCLRCGCTEERACAGGCAWVQGTDICTACLTPGESLVLEELSAASFSENQREAELAEIHYRLFAKYLMEVSNNLPVPFQPTDNFTRAGKLRALRKQFKASCDKLAAAVKNQKRKDK